MSELFDRIMADYKQPLGTPITAACMHFPRCKIDSTQDFKNLAYRVYNTIYNSDVSETSSAIDKGKARSAYNMLIKHLRTRYATQGVKPAPKTCVYTIHHRARKSHQAYQDAKSLPFSMQVLNPMPMPVDISSLDELVDFFRRIEHESHATPDHTTKEGTFEDFQRGAYYTDGRIDLCKQVVGPTHINNLMTSFKNNSHIRHFLLGNNIIGSVGADAIAAFLADKSRRSHISTWYLAGNCIDATGIAKIARELAHDTHCVDLWLKRNPIREDGAKALATMLETNTSIVTLDLDNTAIMDEGCEVLFNSLAHNTTLQNLYISAAGLTARSAAAIAAYIRDKASRQSPGIRRLSIGVNRLGDEGAALICDALRETGYPMKALTLSSNRIELDGLRSILAYASESKSLDVLDIGYYKSTADIGELPNYFGPEGTKLIADFIKLDTPLQVLSLFTCFVDKDILLDAAGYNSRMIKLQIEYAPNVCRDNFAGNDDAYEAHVRKLKHGPNIWVIDSIYRNNM